MNKNTNAKQMKINMLDTPMFTSNKEKMCVYDRELRENIINLREELKYDIPSTTYLTHAIHNFYPAKFIPQVPRFVINKFNINGKIILDPFAGSGTTAIESLITENSNISNDINPITEFFIDVKTLKLNPKNYASYIDNLKHCVDLIFKNNFKFVPRWENIAYWYPNDILLTLEKIWGGIHNIDEIESSLKKILKVSALYLSRKYSYGEDDSPKLFKSKQKRLKMKELLNKYHEFGEELLRNELLKKAKQYLNCIIQFNASMRTEYIKVESLNNTNKQFLMSINNSIEELGKILTGEKIDCIITSPPYIYAQEYFRSSKIDMYWLNIIDDENVRKLTRKEIGQKLKPFNDLNSELLNIKSYKNAIDTVKVFSKNFKTKENISRFTSYFNDMLYFIQLSEKLLVKKGILAIFIGEPKVFGYHIKTKDIFSEMMSLNNFKVKYIFFDLIKSRHLSKNRLNENPSGINGEWLIISEKS